MVDYIDQRPTPTQAVDTLRAQLIKARTPASTPHGIKIARQNEATLYLDSTGSARRWDGDTLANFDERLSEAGKVVVQARQTLQKAELGLVEAESRIQAVEQQTSKDAITKKAVAGLKGLSEPWIGRDMIVPGTIDVQRLNVTQELAAQVVRAMSAETKKLVVTEDAILNRATIIEGLVTSKVAAKLVTSGLLQTTEAERRGLKISSSGIAAYNHLGEQTVKIDANGAENEFRGTFHTSDKSKPGLSIYTTPGRGPAGSIDSVIEMRTGASDATTPSGVVRMNPQGALTLGVQPSGTNPADVKGLVVLPDGDVTVQGRMIMNQGMYLRTLIEQSETTIFIAVGPLEIPRHSAVRRRITFREQVQLPVVVTQAGNSIWPIVSNVYSSSRSHVEVIVHNVTNELIRDAWVDVVVLPIKR